MSGKVIWKGGPFLLLAYWVFAVVWGSAAQAESQIYERGEFRFSVGPVPEFVVQREPAEQWDASAPGASGARWRNWLIDSQSDRRAGKRVRYIDRVYEPVTSEMTREAGKIQIWFNPEFQQLELHRLAIRRNGQWTNRLEPAAVTLARRESQFEQDMATGTVSALMVLNDVQRGDLVRLSYTIRGQNPIMAGLDSEEFVFAWGDPILERHARVLFDSGVSVTSLIDERVPDLVERRSDSALEVSASARKIAALINEGHYPREYAQAPSLVISEKRSWADVVRWGTRLYPKPGPLPEDLERRIASWRALPDESSRIAAALRLVQEEVRYFGIELGDNTHQPAEPSEVWVRRYGDCKDKTRLLVTLLRHLGIQATPALVSFANGARVSSLPPSAAAFDHVITQVRSGNSTLWLDSTATQQRGRPEALLPTDFGVALPLSPTAQTLEAVEPPAEAINKSSVIERFSRGQGESLKLLVQSEYEGEAANRMRRRLETSGNDTVARQYSDYYRRKYGDLATNDTLEVDDDEQANRLKIVERYDLLKPWAESTATQVILETYSDAVADEVRLPGISSRKSPYAQSYPLHVVHVMEFELPTSWSWDGTQQTRTLENDALTFTFSANQLNDKVRIERTLKSLKANVSKEEFPKHFQLLRDISGFLGWRVMVSPPTSDAAKHRDKRLKDLMRGIKSDRPTEKNASAKEAE
jgi:hypothetical protein